MPPLAGGVELPLLLVPLLLVPLLLVPEAPPPLSLLLAGAALLLAGAAVLLAGAAVLLEAGGVAAGVAVSEDGCLAHAVNSTAAASALRATFVFIDSTPME